MKTTAIPLTRIGKFQGIRLTSGMIRRHGFGEGLILEERGAEVVLRSPKTPPKLSWQDTYKEMAAAAEDWSEWDGVSADGIPEQADWSFLPPPVLPATRKTR
jgi:hypothetical protein